MLDCTAGKSRHPSASRRRSRADFPVGHREFLRRYELLRRNLDSFNFKAGFRDIGNSR